MAAARCRPPIPSPPGEALWPATARAVHALRTAGLRALLAPCHRTMSRRFRTPRTPAPELQARPCCPTPTCAGPPRAMSALFRTLPLAATPGAGDRRRGAARTSPVDRRPVRWCRWHRHDRRRETSVSAAVAAESASARNCLISVMASVLWTPWVLSSQRPVPVPVMPWPTGTGLPRSAPRWSPCDASAVRQRAPRALIISAYGVIAGDLVGVRSPVPVDGPAIADPCDIARTVGPVRGRGRPPRRPGNCLAELGRSRS